MEEPSPENTEAALLGEIRDLLVEIRDFEKANAEEAAARAEEFRQLQVEAVARQKRSVQLVVALLAFLFIFLGWSLWPTFFPPEGTGP